MRREELGPATRLFAAVLLAVCRALFRIRVDGIEHMPSHGGAVAAANHVSALDGIVLGAVIWWRARRVPRFLTAAEFFRNPIFGGVLRAYGQIPLVRGTGDAGAIERATAAAARGSVVGIFPEGRVNDVPDGPLQPGRRGAARVALTAGVPVVPVGIWGTQVRFPRSGFRWTRPLRPVLVISCGPALTLEGDGESLDETQSATAIVMVALEERVARARALAAR